MSGNSTSAVGDMESVSAQFDLKDPQPTLVASITEDEDEADEEDKCHAPDNTTDHQHSSLGYLLRYETMVRQQEAEDMASASHIQFCLEKLATKVDGPPKSTGMFWAREWSYNSLQQAVEELENLEGRGDVYEEENLHLLTTDRQLMMVLRHVTQNLGDSCKTTITNAELLQAYRSCIVGMFALQHLPPTGSARQRARDRTLSILSLFQSSASRQIDNGHVVEEHKQTTDTQCISRLAKQKCSPTEVSTPNMINWVFVFIAVVSWAFMSQVIAGLNTPLGKVHTVEELLEQTDPTVSSPTSFSSEKNVKPADGASRNTTVGKNPVVWMQQELQEGKYKNIHSVADLAEYMLGDEIM